MHNLLATQNFRKAAVTETLQMEQISWEVMLSIANTRCLQRLKVTILLLLSFILKFALDLQNESKHTQGVNA